MSARDWYTCPFCKSDMEKAKEEYGKIPIDKFLKKYKESLVSNEFDDSGEEPEDTQTVRMDGEEWLDDDGNYNIDHGLQCNSCGKSWGIRVKVHPTEGETGMSEKLTFKVPSKSGGDDHEVEKDGNNYKCDCVSFRTRKTCSHIDIIKLKIQKSK